MLHTWVLKYLQYNTRVVGVTKGAAQNLWLSMASANPRMKQTTQAEDDEQLDNSSLSVQPEEEQPSDGPGQSSSSESRCPICLENVEEKAFTDPCFHILQKCWFQDCSFY